MLNPQNFWPQNNFAALDDELAQFETARFVVVPVPYDSTTSWQVGTREGAKAIIDASINMEQYDQELQREICEVGIHTTNLVEPVLSRPESMAVRITEVIGEILFAGKIPIMLGGEHSLTFGAVCAALKCDLKGELSILQLDAHTDLRQEYSGTRFGHGCMTRRVSELPGTRIVQLGLRSTSKEEADDVPANVHQFWCEELLADFKNTLDKVLETLTDEVYITFDVDVCDPSWMGSTGTPEPGGLSYYQVRDILKTVCAHKKVIGMDCMELSGGNPAAAFAVARLLYKAMGYLSQ